MAIAFVQSQNTDAETGAATIAVAYPSAVAAGNFLVCGVTWGGTEGTPTCADDVNGAWTAVGNQSWSVNNQGLKCFYFNNTAGGTPTVTVSFGASRTFRGLVIAEYSGVDNTDPIDLDNSFRDDATAGSGTDNASTPAFTPSSDGKTVLAYLMDVDGGTTGDAGTNYTLREETTEAPGDNTFELIHIDRIGAPSGSQQAFFSITNAAGYHSQAIVLNVQGDESTPVYSTGARSIYLVRPGRWG